MAVLKPFRALRPIPSLASKVAALPYDVMDSAEARLMVKGNPYSFLHVDKAEIDLDPAVDLYDGQVYEKAKKNLHKMVDAGTLVQDDQRCFYIYQQTMDGRAQTGLVGCTSIDDYLNNIIKKHELTRAEKEQDRIRHVDCCNANTGPIFLTYRAQGEINQIIEDWMGGHSPVCDFVSEDEIGHRVWVIDHASTITQLIRAFEQIETLYIADGHHRAASAVKVGLKRRTQFPQFRGDEEFNFFLAVLFPDEQLHIMDYNRVVKDLNGHTPDQFLEKVKEKFTVLAYQGTGPCRPPEKHSFGMYLGGQWYLLKANEGTYQENDPMDRLDVSILQNNILTPILGIEDPRTDKRIDFVGGIRGLEELERRVQAGMQVAFSMFPTTIDDLMAIADAGAVMPPKSTWFEPKLRSGLFIHELS
ncbi:DUF1015 domain-containing protein [Candidatus Formimonas warabiya]|uniref:DUF1015 domain-containing protein n=1 Tax=Formimonas warabiya TaxID=1761012 RepID=A0A3G1KMB2_FORW1|nr:DUF1015 family protein [Candidatus Formimonas warabiya]ATW23573.1 hypothetical protein DCMF_01070 [Candidatus Formimonas warabiya]